MRLNGHNHKPRPRFQGQDSYFLGLELEVEASTPEARDSGLLVNKNARYYYAKHDGSLGPWGWEIVTHPFARSLWMERAGEATRHPKDKVMPSGKRSMWQVGAAGHPLAAGPVRNFLRLVKALQDIGYTSHEGGRCGLHVHIGKTAFSGYQPGRDGFEGYGVKSAHYYWFSRIVNGPLMRRLSQRGEDSLDHFAAQAKPRVRTCHLPKDGRYWAVNPTRETVEVRLFRGNMREDRIRKAVEAVVAAVEFSRTLTSRDFVALKLNHFLDRAFIAWVEMKKDIYPNLHGYLVEIGVAAGTPAPRLTEV